MSHWNEIGMMASLGRVPPTVTLTSDASGKWGVPGIWMLVSVPVGGAMGRSSHHSKRAAPDSDSMRGLGQGLAREDSEVPMR